jgi:hypothetical protein
MGVLADVATAALPYEGCICFEIVTIIQPWIVANTMPRVRNPRDLMLCWHICIVKFVFMASMHELMPCMQALRPFPL